MGKISASLMCSNPYTLQKDIQTLEKAKIDYLHLDIMDGHFVPNLGFSIDFIHSLRKTTSTPFDFHLMVENPLKIIPRLSLQKGDIISIHFEASYYLEDIIALLKTYECELFIALNPQTPICILDFIHPHINGINFLTINPGFSGQKLLPQTIEKFSYLKNYLCKNNLKHILIEVDGNMSFQNAKKFKEMGADIFVAGTSSIFPNKKLSKKEIQNFQTLLKG
ncbi:ribulose-phosphate 3-epimerase [Helicobacter turcicus]|uniref:Ribulose-phosphate 3-epimerase n=1 Tax=Helicobacter turcicus TaxID=2867412 RepID=A0ABS7JPZ0_9HELI|nr:ribulose-phosphate 3-epimerase [Helicobacter turcicus]MBX7491430.1 ribulose-phosphate 3-epimerase [Helicobacter turcicus]MBX7545890.1 ribulose-phosphate 3-epimerase [Helicobacter turcicus]